MSAPLVAGIAALVRSTNLALSAEEAGECIEATAGIGTGYTDGRSQLPVGFDPKFSVPASDIPIVNAAAAVECASPPDSPPGEPAGPEVVPVDYQGFARDGRHSRISRDGRYVWFESNADLLPGIRPEGQAVYIRDYVAATTRRIDLPDVRHDSYEELLAISPSGASLSRMNADARAEEIEALQRDLYERISELIHDDPHVSVGWWNEEGASTNWDLLVEVALRDPGDEGTWDQELTKQIRTLVRERTAELVPAAVATTRVVDADKYG